MNNSSDYKLSSDIESISSPKCLKKKSIKHKRYKKSSKKAYKKSHKKSHKKYKKKSTEINKIERHSQSSINDCIELKSESGTQEDVKSDILITNKNISQIPEIDINETELCTSLLDNSDIIVKDLKYLYKKLTKGSEKKQNNNDFYEDKINRCSLLESKKEEKPKSKDKKRLSTRNRSNTPKKQKISIHDDLNIIQSSSTDKIYPDTTNYRNKGNNNKSIVKTNHKNSITPSKELNSLKHSKSREPKDSKKLKEKISYYRSSITPNRNLISRESKISERSSKDKVNHYRSSKTPNKELNSLKYSKSRESKDNKNTKVSMHQHKGSVKPNKDLKSMEPNDSKHFKDNIHHYRRSITPNKELNSVIKSKYREYKDRKSPQMSDKYKYNYKETNRNGANRRNHKIIDKEKLLKIAHKNALILIEKGVLPVGSVKKNLSTAFPIRSVDELTNFCQTLSKKHNNQNSNEDSPNEDSPNEETFKYPIYSKHRPNKISTKLPTKTTHEKTIDQDLLKQQFPVSYGQNHTQTMNKTVNKPNLLSKETSKFTTEVLTTKYQSHHLKKDQLKMSTSVNSRIGIDLLQKTGCKAGEGLGKNKSETLKPITYKVKYDKQGN